ncbi:MAG: universal stress protein [Terriglobales bacterium]
MKLLDARTRVAWENILVATDFSPFSETALRYAAALARRYNSTVHLAHVAPRESRTLQASASMAKLLGAGHLKGVAHQALMGQGEVWEELVDMVGRHHADLIVVGTSGRAGLHKAIEGSVADQILRLAPCPVLTVGPHIAKPTPRVVEFKKIVYGASLQDGALGAAVYAVSLAQEYQAHLTLVHVEPAEGTREEQLALKHAFRTRLQELVPPEAEDWCEPEFDIRFGEAADNILRAAAYQDADLIVLGVHPSPFFWETTAHKVADRARCPVLTVRAEE